MSKKSLLKTRYSFDLSENQLSPSQWEFLNILDVNFENKKLKSKKKSIWNKSDYQYTFYKKLGEAFTEIHWILQKKKNIKKDDIYKVFNAFTLFGFFRNLLVKSEDEDDYWISEFVYDLRTAEIARMMYEFSTSYLLHYKKYYNDPYITDNINRISKSFKTLSYNALGEEDITKTISKPKQEALENMIWDIENKGIYDPENLPEHVRTQDIDIMRDMLNRMTELNFEYDELKKKKNKKLLVKNREEFNNCNKIRKATKKHLQEKIYGENKIYLIKQQLQKKYEHISTYFARINELKHAPDLPENIAKDNTEKSRIFLDYID